MGAPKQKWTAEEEAALKAGVVKHGTGKWRTILMDPEFSSVLRLRSNVDLKDKWRNINVTAIWGSRQKAKLALKSGSLTPKRDESSSTPTSVIPYNEEVPDPKPVAASGGTLPSRGSKELLPKLGSLILEAITTLREPSGSDRASIAMYIEEKKLLAVPNLRKLLAGKLKLLTASGKLVKVTVFFFLLIFSILRLALSIGKQKNTSNLDDISNRILTKSQVEQEILRIQGMTAEEAAAAAAKAVAEAEVAIAEAEEAAREAERAEAEAEACQVFAEAAKKAYRFRARHSW
ncbi:Telomere repeat-binding factor 2 [Linum perenne]